MNEDVVGKTEKEGLAWADDSREEIEKLRLQEEFRREFLGNLSHELKTPIFSIQGYILTLLEGGLEDENINRAFLEIRYSFSSAIFACTCPYLIFFFSDPDEKF